MFWRENFPPNLKEKGCIFLLMHTPDGAHKDSHLTYVTLKTLVATITLSIQLCLYTACEVRVHIYAINLKPSIFVCHDSQINKASHIRRKNG